MNCVVVRYVTVLSLLLGSIVTFSVNAVARGDRVASLTVTVLDTSGEPLEYAVVSLHSDEVTLADPSVVSVMDQRQLQYSPTVLAIQAGSSVSFPNQDDVRHHVYSFSHPNAFELKLYHGEEGKNRQFTHPGIVVLGCNIHDGMLGYIRVVDTPLFSSSDAVGKLHIDQIPPGMYKMQIWHPDLGMQFIEKSVTLKAGKFGTIQTLDISDRKPAKPRATHPLQSLFDD